MVPAPGTLSSALRPAHCGNRGATRYAHDPAGNIVEVIVTEIDGEEKRQSVEVGDMNQVESIAYEGLGKLEITYDSMGRAARFDTGGDVLRVEYAGPSAIGRIVSRATGAEWSPNAAADGNSPENADSRLEVIHDDSASPSQSPYGVVAFDEVSFEAIARDPLESGVPGLIAARRLLAVAEPLFSAAGQGAMMEFEKPSNPIFQPLEYRSTNCCICISVYAKESAGDDDDSPPPPSDMQAGPVCICSPELSPPPDACLAQLKKFKEDFSAEFAAAHQRQLAHTDFCGEPRFGTVCVKGKSSAVEVRSGSYCSSGGSGWME